MKAKESELKAGRTACGVNRKRREPPRIRPSCPDLLLGPASPYDAGRAWLQQKEAVLLVRDLVSEVQATRAAGEWGGKSLKRGSHVEESPKSAYHTLS